MDEIPCIPGKVPMETLVGLYECLQRLKSKPSQRERLPEYIMGKSDGDKTSALVLGSELLLRNSTLGRGRI